MMNGRQILPAALASVSFACFGVTGLLFEPSSIRKRSEIVYTNPVGFSHLHWPMEFLHLFFLPLDFHLFSPNSFYLS